MKGAASLVACGCAPRIFGFAELGVPELVLGVISDIHVTTPDSTMRLERVLRFFRDRKVDAVMICGDLADWGLLSGLKYVAEAWERVFPGNKGSEGRATRRIFCTGNHDYEGWWYGDMTAEMHALGYDEDEALASLGMKKCWEEVFQEDFAPVRKRTVNGFDFVSAEWHRHGNAPGCDKTAEWFAAHGDELDPSKPFFFQIHMPPAETTAGSGVSELSRMVRNTLAAYPNAVAFSGHRHWTLNDERSIWQGDFTAVSVPSLSYTSLPKEHENGNDVRDGTSTRSMPLLPARFNLEEPQGLVVSIYRDRMELERYDFANFAHTAPTWEVPLPTNAGARPFAFEPRRRREPVPEFPANATLSLATRNTNTRGGKWEVALVASFPAAKGVADARVFDYEIRATLADGSVSMTKRFLSPAFHKMKKDEPDNVLYWFNVLDLPQDADYRLEVYPRNCFGDCGKPLVSPVRHGKPGGADVKC